MKGIRRILHHIPKPLRFLFDLLLAAVLFFAWFVARGGPRFGEENRFRQAEKANLVGPSVLLDKMYVQGDWIPTHYNRLLIGDSGDEILFYTLTNGRRNTEMDGALIRRDKSDGILLTPLPDGFTTPLEDAGKDFSIPLYLRHTVTDIHGRERLSGVTVARVDDQRRPVHGSEIFLDCDTLLLSCGLIPENELSQGAGVELSPLTSGPVVDETLETSVPGIFACGNVLHVHDLVDHVSDESFRAGRAAAAFVCRGSGTQVSFTVKDGPGVRGTVPQKVSSSPQGDVPLMFRPSDVFRNACAVVECDGREIMRKKAMIYTPGEMVSLTLKKDLFDSLSGSVITVRIEGDKQHG